MSQYSRLVLERLMLYHRYLTQKWEPDSPLDNAVASREIAQALDIDATQVRKDLASIGLRGRGRVGFRVKDTVKAIRRVLGFDQTHLAIVVGAGHLGGALAAYPSFALYGVRVVAAFDRDEDKVGDEIGGCPVRHVGTVKEFIRQHQIRLGIITTPASAAQAVADDLIDAGIQAIWNFAPTSLRVPEGFCLRNERISLGLAVVAHDLTHR